MCVLCTSHTEDCQKWWTYTEYDAYAGTTITNAAKNMILCAKEIRRLVKTNFNGITMWADYDENVSIVTTRYSVKSDLRGEAYRCSSDGKAAAKRCQEAEEAQHKQDEQVRAILSSAAPIALKDAEWLAKTVEVNSDGYGSCVVHFAENWARLMHVRLTDGKSVKDCTNETSHLADMDGITGFMYGYTVSILSQVREHSEELRPWHNLDTQIGNEGELTNKKGGVINPAMLCVGVG